MRVIELKRHAGCQIFMNTEDNHTFDGGKVVPLEDVERIISEAGIVCSCSPMLRACFPKWMQTAINNLEQLVEDAQRSTHD